MALDYVTLSENMVSGYNELKTNLVQDNEKQTPYPSGDVGTTWMDAFKLYYDEDSNNGEFSEVSVVMVSDQPTLEFDNYLQTCNGDDMIAERISAYWSGQTTFGEPLYTSIVSISNDASKIQEPIETYICSLPGNEEYTPHYEHLFSYIEEQVKTIVWTVQELNGTTPVTYTVSIT